MTTSWTSRQAQCECGHSDTAHNLNDKEERTRCDTFFVSDGGPCGCKRFVLAGWHVWTSTRTWEPA